jgi:5-(carboxyamino)imidazole ribonucleotide mutase
MDSLLSIVQMPGGVPVATMAIGKAGAINAALLAAAILANHDAGLHEKLREFREQQARAASESTLP